MYGVEERKSMDGEISVKKLKSEKYAVIVAAENRKGRE